MTRLRLLSTLTLHLQHRTDAGPRLAGALVRTCPMPPQLEQVNPPRRGISATRPQEEHLTESLRSAIYGLAYRENQSLTPEI